MYEYACRVTRIVDGDTVVMELDLGFHLSYSTHARLAGIDAPEMKTPQGPAAKAHLTELVLNRPGLLVRTVLKHEFEKYGRVLATLFAGPVNINAKMIEDGFAVAIKET